MSGAVKTELSIIQFPPRMEISFLRTENNAFENRVSFISNKLSSIRTAKIRKSNNSGFDVFEVTANEYVYLEMTPKKDGVAKH